MGNSRTLALVEELLAMPAETSYSHLWCMRKKEGGVSC